MKLPINENPSVYTYADLGFMTAILENRELLRLRMLNCENETWEATDTVNVCLCQGNISVFAAPNEENTEGKILRNCQLNDEMIVKIDYYKAVDEEAYISFLVKDESEDIDNSQGHALTSYGFFINDKMLKFERLNDYQWFKLVRKENEISFFASANAEMWDLIYTSESSWLPKSKFPQIGIRYSLGNYQYYHWKYMNFTQLFLNTNDKWGNRWIDYYMFPRKGYDHLYGIFDHFIDTEYLCADEICEIYGSVSNFADYSINKGYYILIRLDEYHIPGRKAYQRYHYEHDNLIYGYDEKNYNLLGFDLKVVADELPKDILEKTYYRDKKVIRHRFLVNGKKLEFNINNFILTLHEFIEGKNSGEKYSHLLFPREGIYGLKIFEYLLNDDKAKALFLKDVRASYIFYEHSKIMRERLDYLIENSYIDYGHKGKLLDKCDDILSTAQKLKSLVLKVVISKRGDSKVYACLDMLYQKEKDAYYELYYALGLCIKNQGEYV
ncbi:MAG: hypothetical protein FWG91_01455 [Lachnospiraceae bacterium]|nr:hypothetical protein [Lachnospiraceae bacterium]